jgi:hypothetical protein
MVEKDLDAFGVHEMTAIVDRTPTGLGVDVRDGTAVLDVVDQSTMLVHDDKSDGVVWESRVGLVAGLHGLDPVVYLLPVTVLHVFVEVYFQFVDANSEQVHRNW